MNDQNHSAGLLPLPFLERVAGMLRLLAHAHRLKIVELLQIHGHLPVFELHRLLGISQAVTSQHLNSMKRVGLLSAERRGKEVWYSIADPRALTILNCIRNKRETT